MIYLPVAPPVTTATRPWTVKRSAADRDGDIIIELIVITAGDFCFELYVFKCPTCSTLAITQRRVSASFHFNVRVNDQ
jgi:hypothetical protein